MQVNPETYKTVVIGGGPAGTGLLYNAIRKKELRRFLDQGVAFVERTDELGCGSIGKYMINSDTEGRVFLECLAHAEGLPVDSPKLKEMVDLISEHANASVPLKWVGDYLQLMGSVLKEQIQHSAASALYFRSTAVSVCRESQGTFLTKIKTVGDAGEKESFIRSASVVFAMGGAQDRERIVNSTLSPDISLKQYEDKLFMTDALFSDPGNASAMSVISESKNKKIVVIGSSHSALSSICLLLNRMPQIDFGENDITLLYRNKFKLFYPTKEQAWKDGYQDFTDADICPVSQKVHRLGGIRLESGALLKKILGIHQPRESRVRPLKISMDGENSIQLKDSLDAASIIVPAFGYRPRTVPLQDEGGQEIGLSCNKGGALVNNKCQVIDVNGNAIAGLYGIGLASGFVPQGKLGGEPGFTGQTNGLWLYQNGVGEIIYDQLMGR